MARLPRITVPGIAHHVTQRGNRRQQVFIQEEEEDYALYRDLLAQYCVSNGVEVWSYCLMPNHVHLILVPGSQDGLSRAIGETHRRYSGYINEARGQKHGVRSRIENKLSTVFRMVRPLRIAFSRDCIMLSFILRGDRREDICADDTDREMFLESCLGSQSVSILDYIRVRLA